MLYNKKIVQTASYLEIWEYGTPINIGFTKKKTSSKKNIKNDDIDKLKRLVKTRKNAKHELMRLIDSNFDEQLTKFITITTQENIQDRKIFNQEFDKFMKRLNYNVFHSKKKMIKYVAVLEKQKRGAYHAHILVFNLPFIKFEKLRELWKLGSIRINKVNVDSIDNRGRYITKYMEKGIGQELIENKGKKSYYSSNNLKQPIISKLLDDDSIDDLISDKFIVNQSEYISKIYKDGEWIENKVKYRKVKI
ncbi:rolling circle replication-associated protein [Streptococcus uberis]|uniref:rolling circle replication-associated protein n=1 Tax=Streptococcus uberis TaxID=1349 RepID=UPI001FF54417|nr:Rep protein [Streptococcus uberis]MCK1213515.1 Rep protein [Streptococcus uberis]MCK1215035.1 Rep protein [Streptococcus uberis]